MLTSVSSDHEVLCLTKRLKTLSITAAILYSLRVHRSTGAALTPYTSILVPGLKGSHDQETLLL